MDTVKISVIMPIYNPPKDFFKEAIESILNQSYENFELIIINDGSDEYVEEIIKTYKDSRIKYYYQENRGVSAARNKGLKLAQGEYIAMADSDDISDKYRLEKQLEYLKNHQDVSLIGSWIKRIPQNCVIKFQENIGIIDLLADCCVMQPTIMFKKEIIEKYSLYYDENLICAEDYDLYARAIKHIKIANVQECLVNYRVYESNTSSTKREERVISSFIVQEKLLNLLSDDESTRKKILDVAYSQKYKRNSWIEWLFSMKNLYKDWKKYKLFTILGIEINIFLKTYGNRQMIKETY